MPGIKFIQSTLLGDDIKHIGLYDIFIAQFARSYTAENILTAKQVVVPNLVTLEYIRDKIALTTGICANVNFHVLLSTLLQKWYLTNNPEAIIYDFNQSKYIIYDYLCTTQITTHDAQALNQYIYPNKLLNKNKVYQLATQLQQIFHEYIYLRTNEMLNLGIADFPQWQKQIIRHLLDKIKPYQTFLDIFSYFTANKHLDLAKLILPKELFIFSIPNIYPSQLHIIKILSEVIQVYWYYQPNSYEYYGDLLSNAAKNSLAKKLSKQPHLNLDDLYLNEGNTLLASLGTGSREFIELLQIFDIEVINYINPDSAKDKPNTMLEVMQQDIKQIKSRVAKEYRTNNNTLNYVEPVSLTNLATSGADFYDLANCQSSIKINSCHNKMREVQVMFNEIANLLHTGLIKFDEIVICAPDINLYASYISAVFDNEYILDDNKQSHKLEYNILGANTLNNKIFETLKLILNTPYDLPVTYLLQILTQGIIQDNLAMSINDIEQIKLWLYANKTKFGYNEKSYALYGYDNYSVHSFKQFINNMVLGSCLSGQIFAEQDKLPITVINNTTIIPYDNLDYSQLELANKVINLIEILEYLQGLFYVDSMDYRELDIKELHQVLSYLQHSLIKEEKAVSLLQKFIGELAKITLETKITLPIVNLMLDEYLVNYVTPVKFTAAISCASMREIRRIPYSYVYILGLNFGEFPTNYRPPQLSILAHQWQLADRNYNLEDKQVFLDIIGNTKKQLFLSYIGANENNNSLIKPSPLLNLFINTMGRSFINLQGNETHQFDYKNIIQQHSLHPFSSNKQPNYSIFWHNALQGIDNYVIDKRWDFTQISPIELTKEQQLSYYNTNILNITNTFLYTNNNLYKTLNLKRFNNTHELDIEQSIELNSRDVAKQIYNYFNQYYSKYDLETLQYFLQAKGVVAYKHIGELQLKYYVQLYNNYLSQIPIVQNKLELDISYTNQANKVVYLSIIDTLYCESDNIIIMENFENIADKPLLETAPPYTLKIRALIIKALVSAKNIKLDFPVKETIVRLINSKNEKKQWIVQLNQSDEVLDSLLRYYIRSFSNPLLIHKGAIDKFAKDSRELKPNSQHKYSPENCVSTAEKFLLAEFNNYELDKIKQDPIFSNIVLNYFALMKEYNYNNDIIKIGELLASANFIMLK